MVRHRALARLGSILCPWSSTSCRAGLEGILAQTMPPRRPIARSVMSWASVPDKIPTSMSMSSAGIYSSLCVRSMAPSRCTPMPSSWAPDGRFSPHPQTGRLYDPSDRDRRSPSALRPGRVAQELSAFLRPGLEAPVRERRTIFQSAPGLRLDRPDRLRGFHCSWSGSRRPQTWAVFRSRRGSGTIGRKTWLAPFCPWCTKSRPRCTKTRIERASAQSGAFLE